MPQAIVQAAWGLTPPLVIARVHDGWCWFRSEVSYEEIYKERRGYYDFSYEKVSHTSALYVCA